MTIKAVYPATGAVIGEYPEMGADEVDGILERSYRAFEAWRRTRFEDRAALMRRAAAILRARKDEYGALMAQEMGKPVKDGRAEAEKCAWVCEYYAEHAEGFLRSEDAETDAAPQLRRVSPPRRRARRDALELPVLAGVPLRGARA